MLVLHKIRRPPLVVGLLSLLVIAGCESPSALAPVSSQGQAINNLIMVIFVVALVAAGERAGVFVVHLRGACLFVINDLSVKWP